MSPDLDAALCADYPMLFADRGSDPRESCMHWGFECGDGWEPLIRDAAEQLTYLAGLAGVVVTAAQIKEKYGTLRFYFDVEMPDGVGAAPLWSIFYAIVSTAESRSAHTCETCGEFGELRGRGWLYTACTKHTRPADLPEPDPGQAAT